MTRFEGKVVLVTGGARGQGRSHAVSFAREGADVAVCDLDHPIASVAYPHGDPDGLDQTAELVRAEGRRALSGVADVRDLEQVGEFTERVIAEFGRLDVVIANAGIISYAPIEEMTDEQFSDLVDVNLKGVWNTFKAAVPQMRRQRYGRLLATGSAASLRSFPQVAHYVAAKHALKGLVEVVAIETAADGITVNLVCPGNVGTEMILNQSTYEAVSPGNPTKEGFAAVFDAFGPQPGSWMEPEEISKAMLHVASADAARMTGSVVVVDMGQTIT